MAAAKTAVSSPASPSSFSPPVALSGGGGGDHSAQYALQTFIQPSQRHCGNRESYYHTPNYNASRRGERRMRGLPPVSCSTLTTTMMMRIILISENILQNCSSSLFAPSSVQFRPVCTGAQPALPAAATRLPVQRLRTSPKIESRFGAL